MSATILLSFFEQNTVTDFSGADTVTSLRVVIDRPSVFLLRRAVANQLTLNKREQNQHQKAHSDYPDNSEV